MAHPYLADNQQIYQITVKHGYVPPESVETETDNPVEKHIRHAHQQTDDDEVLYHLREALQLVYANEE